MVGKFAFLFGGKMLGKIDVAFHGVTLPTKNYDVPDKKSFLGKAHEEVAPCILGEPQMVEFEVFRSLAGKTPTILESNKPLEPVAADMVIDRIAAIVATLLDDQPFASDREVARRFIEFITSPLLPASCPFLYNRGSFSSSIFLLAERPAALQQRSSGLSEQSNLSLAVRQPALRVNLISYSSIECGTTT